MNNPKSTQKIITVVFVVLLFSSASLGQPLNSSKELSQYSIDHFTDQKIPSSTLQIIQAQDGYLWMATLNGIVRFDGVKATIFDKFNTPSLGINGFKCVYEDVHKNLWIGSIGGGLFLKKRKGFKQFVIPFGESSNNIENIKIDSKDNLWICTVRGLVQFKDSTFTLIPLPGHTKESDLITFDVDEDKEGNLWIASSIGILKYANGKLKKHNWEGISLDGEISAIEIDDQQNIWICAYGRGIYKVTNNRIEKVEALNAITRAVALVEDSNHNIWIGSETGLARCNDNGVSFLTIERGLTSDHVTGICEDHEGSIWLATYYGGINRLRDGAFTNYTQSNGLPHATIHSIYQTHDSTIWAGTESNLAYFKKGNFQQLQFPELKNARVRDLLEDEENNVWIATYNGLFKLTGQKLKKYSLADGLASEQTRVLFKDSKKNLWIGTRNGLNLYSNNTLATYSEKEGLLNTFIMSILERHDGTLVVGTNGGLYIFNGKTFDPYITNQGRIGSTVFRMYEDTDGYLWVGTSAGLICIKDKTLYSFTSTDRLLGGNIYEVMEDQLGMLWLTSSIGIVTIDKKEILTRIQSGSGTLTPRLFDKSSGLRTSEITATSHSLISFDKTIWFPTLEGISIIDPANILTNKIPPPIAIEKVLVDGIEVDPVQEITIQSRSRNIEIHYSALSFMIPQKVQYKYMLAGYDKKWQDVGDRRIAIYTSLPPGNYVFKLSASNNDSVWSTEEKALSFHVEKAFWQSWIFYTMAILVAALLTFGIVDYRIRNIKTLNRILDDRIKERTHEVLQQKEEIESQRDYIESKHNELEKARNLIAEQYEKLREVNETLEEKVDERTQELQKAYADLIQANEELDYFVYKSAHDIKGPLARLQGLCNLAIIEAPDETSKNYMTLLQKESILANRVIQKLSHAHEIKNMAMEISDVNLNNAIFEIINQLTATHSEATNVKFIVDVDRNTVLYSDRRLIKELLFNLLENAVVFQSEESQLVHIRSSVEDNKVSITIFDNGIGIDDRIQKDIFKMFVKGSEKSIGLGLGLYITKKTTEKLHGLVGLKKSNKQGTEFEIQLPLRLTKSSLEKLTAPV